MKKYPDTHHRLVDVLQKERRRRQLEKDRYNWFQQARPEQLIPEGSWRVWLILAGRGFGKTRTGAETVRYWVDSGQYRRIALIGDNIINAQQVMIEGVSGLLQCYPPGQQPHYERSKQRLVWTNGAVAELFTAEGYENLRGPQFDAAWIDELAKFRMVDATWEQLMLGLRLGKSPRCIITTTPKPIPLLESLVKRSDVVVTRGSTFDNEVNLSADFIELMRSHYAKTRLAAQELYGNLLTDHSGALWTRSMIRYQQPKEAIV
jgi:phage terminase large subunit-like protein